MRNIGKLGGAAVVAGVVLSAAALPGGAVVQQSEPYVNPTAMTVEPTSGPALSSFTVSADAVHGCGSLGGGSVGVALRTTTDHGALVSGIAYTAGNQPSPPDYSWSITLTVPSWAVEGAYDVTATCQIPGLPPVDYPTMTFTVVAAPATTTTTTTTTQPSTSTTAATTTSVPSSTAGAVSGTPSFTG